MRTLDAVVWSVGGLAGALGLLLVLAENRPPSAPPPPSTPPVATKRAPSRVRPTPPPPLPDEYRDHVGRLQEFSRSEVGGRFGLSYAFVDHHARTHRVYCEVPKGDHERESARYGYDEDEVNAALDAPLRRYLQDELEARGLAPYVRIKVSRGRYSAESELPPMETEAQARLLGRIQEFFGPFWKDQVRRKRDELEAALFAEHGLTLKGGHYGPDYAQLAARARQPLDDCFRALARAGDGYGERQLLGLFVAFFQEIRYEIPPDTVGRRRTSGLWVPTEVVVGGHGDCDSKATAFASLWMNVGSPIILIDLPRHMLVGVEVRPGPGERYVLVRNRYFVICEVAGPGKWHPGAAGHATLSGISGDFTYTMLGVS